MAAQKKDQQRNYYVVVTEDGSFKGIVSSSNLFSTHHDPVSTIESLIKRKPLAVTDDNSLKEAVEIMANENIDVVPVISSSENKVTGILSYKDILSVYRLQVNEHQQMLSISVKRKTLKLLVRGKKKLSFLKGKE